MIISTHLDRELITAAIFKKPEWCPTPWPQVSAPTDRDVRQVALLKLQLLFDFAARLPGETRQEIREALWQRFPAVRAALSDDVCAVRYERIPVEATIWSDGRSDAGYGPSDSGEELPFGSATEDSMDVFIKNSIRADIRALITSGGSEWTPHS